MRLRLRLKRKQLAKNGLHMLAITLLLVMTEQCAAPKVATNTPWWHKTPTITSANHYDEGDSLRYTNIYEPITFGCKQLVDLPGFAVSYEITDWNHDGLIDILAYDRRGAGLVFYKNVGSNKQPLFRSLQKNTVIMQASSERENFSLIDIDKDGIQEIITGGQSGSTNHALFIYHNQGSADLPVWDSTAVRFSNGTLFNADIKRFTAVDLDGDKREDIVYGNYSLEELVPSDKYKKSEKKSGFKDPTEYNPYCAKIYWCRNVTSDPKKPIFNLPQSLTENGAPIITYVEQYVGHTDIDKNGTQDLIVGTHKPGLQIFLNFSDTTQVVLKNGGLLKDSDGNPYKTASILRVKAGDFDGDGADELVGASYHGCQSRYFLLDQVSGGIKDGWNNKGALQMMSDEKTPLFGFTISTVDAVDWDGDGDRDLLLGAEPTMPMIFVNKGNDEQPVYEPGQALKYIDGSLLETQSIKTGVGSYWGPFEWYFDRISPRAVDWDNDGVLDIISGSMGKRLYFFRGQMVEGELRFNPPQNFQSNGSDLSVPDRIFPTIADWNADGMPDILISNDFGNVVVYFGNQNIELSEPDTLYHKNGAPILITDYWNRQKGNRSGFELADWDDDGLPDLFINEFHKGVIFYKNEGDNKFAQGQQLLKIYSHQGGINVLDWDMDGALDILVGGDERRMIETDIPGQVVVYHGKHINAPSLKKEK